MHEIAIVSIVENTVRSLYLDQIQLRTAAI